MRIVQLITQRRRRGAQIFAGTLSESLASRGHSVELAGLYRAEESLECSGVRVVDLGGRTGRPLRPEIVKTLCGYLASARPDVVQANSSDTLKYSAIAKRLLGAPWPLVYRNANVASAFLHYPLHREWIRWLLRSVDHVASVADAARDDFASAFGYPASRLSTIRGGIVLSDVYDPIAARAMLAELARVPVASAFVIHAASFTPEKNHRWLIEIFRRLAPVNPNVHLVLLGDGPLRREVEAQIDAAALAGRVHCLGTRDDAARLMAGADLQVISSTIEGIPGVVLEAAAQGVTTVATDVGGMAEAIVDGVTGMLVRPGDTAAFVAAVQSLLRDSTRRMRMGGAARQMVARHYDMDVVTAAFEDLYAGLVRPHDH